MITRKEALTLLKQAFRDLVAQGEFGWDGRCQYQTPEGNNCVIGLMIKRNWPEVDLTKLNGSVYVVWLRHEALGLPDMTRDVIDLWTEAQTLHDGCVGPAKRPTWPLLLEEVRAMVNSNDPDRLDLRDMIQELAQETP